MSRFHQWIAALAGAVALCAAAGSTAAAAPGSPPATPPPATKPGSEALRAEVQAFVKSYVEAQNTMDASAMMEMVSRNPAVASITMGDLLRGWEAIRDEVDAMVGSEGEMRIALGTIEVVPLGPVHVLAFAPCVITLKDETGEDQLRGALSLVLEKSTGKWKVLHEHASVQFPEDDEDDAQDDGAALPAAFAGSS